MTDPTPKTSTANSSACHEIPFEIMSAAAETMLNVPMTSGLCFPKGAITNNAEWQVQGPNGAQCPAQTEVLNRWSDGSIRWLLTHFVAEEISAGRTVCRLVRGRKDAIHAPGRSSLRWDGDTLTLQLTSTGDDAEPEAELKLAPELRDSLGQSRPIKITEVTEETVGDVRCVYVARATAAELPFIDLRLRLEIWPTAGLVKIETRIRNTRRAAHKGGLWDLGDAGSFVFDALHVNINGTHGRGGSLSWKAEQQSPVRECATTESFGVLQRGSGSAAWSNSNHNNASDEQTVFSRGYRANSSAGVFRGYRSEPTVAIQTEDDCVSVAVAEFWQQFPSSLSVNENTISVGLFPFDALSSFELQGGEQKTLSTWISTRASDAKLNHLNWVYQPPRPILSAQWVKQCDVVAWMPEGDQASYAAKTRFDAYIEEATSNGYGFSARRDAIDEYGWRNFGDVPADHEQTHYDGTNTVISHYNNQFDMVFGAIQNLLTSGDSKWFGLFEPLARHLMDIDIYHTTEDRGCFNGGLFWHTDHYVDARTATHRTYSRYNADGKVSYGGGPSNEHNYTTGLLYYYFLTGSPEAFETVTSLADWVLRMDDGSRTIWGLFDSGDTGLASQTVFEDFHGPGRGVGNSINALLDAWILTRQDGYIEKAEQLIRRAVHPDQDCEALHLAEAEGHWSYTVCLTALGRYLNAKLEAGQLDENYAYVRETLAHYGRWMTASEKPALSEPDKLDYPTEAWAAQEFRKANALRIAASCTDDAKEEAAMRRKADELNDAAWEDLYQFGSQHLTARCLSILMTEGLRDIFHRSCRPEYMPPVDQSYDWGEWTMFIPQKQRVKQLLKNPLRAAVAVARACNPRRVARTVDAIRRQL